MIRILVRELATVDDEAILRPVSSALLAVTAPGREVDRAAGSEVAERLKRFGSLPVGGALVTPGGDLTSPFLIHVVVQSAEEPVTDPGIRRALLNGLRRASEWGIRSVAMPPLGTGAGNLDAEASARVMVPLLREHMRSHDRPESVTVCVGTEYEEEVFQRAVARAEREVAPVVEEPDVEETEEVPEGRA